MFLPCYAINGLARQTKLDRFPRHAGAAIQAKTGFTHHCRVTLYMKKQECLGGKIFDAPNCKQFQLFSFNMLNNNAGTQLKQTNNFEL